MASNARLMCIQCVFRHVSSGPSFDSSAPRGARSPVDAEPEEETVMNHDSLDTFSEAIQAAWSPLDSALVAHARAALARLLVAPASEEWRRALVEDAPESRELVRDPSHGYVLLAHTEPTGLYRPPHDHGRGWVAYGVLRGELEMRTYRRVHDLRGGAYLVQRESFTLRPGDVRVFLPGDIHDTRCLSGPSLLFRFTERDLKQEDQEAHRVTRYVERDGVWTVGPA